jgi:hypothetical protein
MKYLSQIETPTDSYVAHYPWAIEMAIKQQSLFWPAEELGVEEDEQDFRTKLIEGELHGVLTAQSIITQYELMIGGDELWGGKIARMFPRPEIQRMCACFANVELGSHAPFYDLGNKVLGKATDEFYTQWKLDPVLAERIQFISDCAASNDALEVTAALAFLEGAILFSVLGFFKGFNSRGFNLIPHFVSGIDGSTSTAIGAAFASEKQTDFITGDLSFFYDSNALWNKNMPSNFRIIIINNSGGGIFKIIPGQNSSNVLDYFQTPHCLTAAHLAKMFEFEYLNAFSTETVQESLGLFYNSSEKPKILEIFTPSNENSDILNQYFKFIQ